MDLRKSIAALGHSLPRSVVGIRDQVLKYGQQLRQDISRNLSIKGFPGSRDFKYGNPEIPEL